MALTPDKTYKTKTGVNIKEFFINNHNKNGVDIPAIRTKKLLGITVHNTAAVSTSLTQSHIYSLATYNNNMSGVIVNYYCCSIEAWHILPDNYCGYHAADGANGPGNSQTISVEIVMNGTTGSTNDKAEDNGAKLVAQLLYDNKLTIKDVYKHQDWYPPKKCPTFIIDRGWNKFLNKVEGYLNSLNGKASTTTTTSTTTQTQQMYRIRKTWDNAKSQIGAYTSLDNAKKACKEGYTVYDNNGKAVYTNSTTSTTTSKPSTSTSAEKINIIYQVYGGGRWIGEVTNCNDKNDEGYAGIENTSIRGIAAKVSKGTISYKAHVIGGGWLGNITNYNINDWNKGCAGIKTKDIDAIQLSFSGVSDYEVRYRVSIVGSKDYLPWVIGTSDYAGIFGKKIDKVQIEIIKK